MGSEARLSYLMTPSVQHMRSSAERCIQLLGYQGPYVILWLYWEGRDLLPGFANPGDVHVDREALGRSRQFALDLKRWTREYGMRDGCAPKPPRSRLCWVRDPCARRMDFSTATMEQLQEAGWVDTTPIHARDRWFTLTL